MAPSNLYIDLFLWFFNAVAVTAVAYLVFRLLRGTSAALNLALFIFSWTFVCSVSVLLMGLAGLLDAVSLGVLAAITLLALAAVPAARHELRSAIPSLRSAAALVVRWYRQLPPWLRWFSLAIAIVSVLRFAFVILVLPPFVWDSLTYHLTNVAHWVQAGRIELWQTPMVRIYTPANYELLAAWFSVFLHHDAVIEAAGLPAYLLGIAAVMAVARELGARPTASWLAALAYATMPAFLIVATGTKNDPHMAAYILTALAIILRLTNDADLTDREAAGGLLALALVLLLAAGTKAYIAHALPGLLLVGLINAWRTGQIRSLWSRLRGVVQAWGGLPAAARWLAVVLILAGLFLGGYWNIRNWILTGNPFYPYGVSVEGDQLIRGPHQNTQLNVGRAITNLEIIINKLGDGLAPIRPDLPDVTGWGWFAYVIGVPSLLWALWRSAAFRVVVAGLSVSLFLVLMSTRPTPWNMRYIIWLPAVFCLAFAAFWDAGPPEGWLTKWAFPGLYMLTTTLGFMAVFNYGVISPDEFSYMMERSVWSRPAASFHQTVPAEYENALVYVPPDAVLGYNVHGNGFIYPLYRADFSQRLVYIPVSNGEGCEAIAGSMRQAGTRYLSVAPEHTSDDVIAKLRSCADDGTFIRQRARGLYVLNDG